MIDLHAIMILICDPGGSQTPNLLIRSQMLYSVELRGQLRCKDRTFWKYPNIGKGFSSSATDTGYSIQHPVSSPCLFQKNSTFAILCKKGADFTESIDLSAPG